MLAACYRFFKCCEEVEESPEESFVFSRTQSSASSSQSKVEFLTADKIPSDFPIKTEDKKVCGR